MAGDARSEASAVVSEAGTQARALADEARTSLRQQASDGASRAAGAVDQLAGRLRALADGNTEQAGDLQRYARDLGDRLGGVAGRMQERGVDGLVDDVQRFARRRPGVVPGGRSRRRLRGRSPLPRGQGRVRASVRGASTGNGHTARRRRRGGLSGWLVEPGCGGRPDDRAAVRRPPAETSTSSAGRPSSAGSAPEPATKGAERTGPEGGSTPAPTPYGGATRRPARRCAVSGYDAGGLDRR